MKSNVKFSFSGSAGGGEEECGDAKVEADGGKQGWKELQKLEDREDR